MTYMLILNCALKLVEEIILIFLSVSATYKNHTDSGLDTAETSSHMQIISSLLNTSYIVVIKNTAVWAIASFCMQ